MTTRIRFQINLLQEEYLRYYQGAASAVIVHAEDGRRVQIPANSLRPFVGQQGIQGRFEIMLDQNNKLIDITKLD
ncbi:hypothetical protein MNBD_GAMMA26-160 [hydrothermal vent metagenome]|uniref:DUF2835 domain-containing protein n=1 Tax=hydrothermal vent metagenome TaxID=652676 RepID=A0A3B1BIJ5_9ZZZZ